MLWPEGTTAQEKEDAQTLAPTWGSLGKSNFATLKWREPVYANVRELAMSFFDVYFTMDGTKSLRAYSDPIALDMFMIPYREKTQEVGFLGFLGLGVVHHMYVCCSCPQMHRVKGASYKARSDVNWMFDESSMEDIDYELMNCRHYPTVDPLRAKCFRMAKATPMLIKCVTIFTNPDAVFKPKEEKKESEIATTATTTTTTTPTTTAAAESTATTSSASSSTTTTPATTNT
jgi:hypothetical protein